mgnify:CR=1 FL=1
MQNSDKVTYVIDNCAYLGIQNHWTLLSIHIAYKQQVWRDVFHGHTFYSEQ